MATIAIPVATPRRGTRQQHISGRATIHEVCFSKVIDNSRLRREVDPDRKRECYSLLLTATLLFVVILGIAWQHFDCVKENYQIEELKKEGATLQELNKQLRLEKAAMTDPQRIDALARQDLGLIPPAPQQVIQVGGAPPGSGQAGDSEFARNDSVVSPASSIVAREP
ncbi:MAG TPA: cell division protein FtsL [Terriglobia bacterium]|nr:cell division protein FtsL [Terriglobia bacterium]